MANYEQYNASVTGWARQAEAGIKASGRSLGIIHRNNSPSPGESLAKITGKTFEDKFGVISRITFSRINRSLIYTSAGAGRGQGGRKGSTWINAKGERKRTNPRSLGKQGTGNRTEKRFVSNFLDGNRGIENLADIVANGLGDVVADNILVK